MKRLLFVDDDPQLLSGMKAKLYSRRGDWDMQFVGSAAAAMKLLHEQRIDILVTDIRMPGVDGATLAARAMAESPHTIRIVLSGFADAESSQRLLAVAHRYLSKPCEPKRLEECIDRCLGTLALIESPDIRSKLGKVGALPPIPVIFAALQKALADPSTDSRTVSRIIQRDPAICVKVLQVCNSAFFRLPRRISGVDQAVNYLGMSAVRSIALSAELFRAGSSLSPSLDLDQLQRHALGVAVIARFLAKGCPWADDAFLAGLLHDVGYLLLGRQFKDPMEQAMAAAVAGMPPMEAERQFIGIDHATAGGYLLAIWGIPYEVVETVVHHDSLAARSGETFDIESAIVIAHGLLRIMRPKDIPVMEAYDAHVDVIDDDYLRKIHYPHTWESLVEQTRELLETEEAA